MKKRDIVTIFDKYVAERIERSKAEDSLFLVAKSLVMAKDMDGINLFWDEEEERDLREFIETTESVPQC